MRIGILTGGGDCPGLNAVIRAVVRKGVREGDAILGIHHGWQGMLTGQHEELTQRSVSGLIHRGGTILHTSRTNPFKEDGGSEKVVATFKRFNLDGLIAIGGDDTLGVANKLFKMGLPVVGVPKTIDNDLSGTDFTFGFDTAVTVATEAIDRLHTTAESHDRVMVVEVMGRQAGWIAVYSGLAGGADVILIPEKPFNLDEVAEVIKARHSRGKNFSIVVAAEGAHMGSKNDQGLIKQSEELDEFGHARLGGIGQFLAKELENRTGFESRVTVLGHVQRGGSPTPHDRILATIYGVKAHDLVHEGKFGTMAALVGGHIDSVSLEDAVRKLKTVDMNIYKIAEIFFG
ncbi:MAG: 6-phosphofructokinase [Deltaproteobacteria bacterium]|nr:6-phosphofructokinase [Deltaproteobacteria bacterium]